MEIRQTTHHLRAGDSRDGLFLRSENGPESLQALHLLNGPAVSTKIEQGALVTRMLAEGKKPEEIIEEVYLRSLTSEAYGGRGQATPRAGQFGW